MKVIKANVLGFCMGVRRAVEIALEEAKSVAQESTAKVFTLGPLIHNPIVLAELQALGIQSIDESICDNLACSADSASVIIRAHGVSPATENALREKGYRVVDATCPRVKANQLKTRELSRAGFHLFIAGEAKHAEVAGLLGYGEEAPYCQAAGSADEAREKARDLFNRNSKAKTALVGQTTISENEYIKTAEELKKVFPDIQVLQTICAAASERQNALRELLNETDAVIIAGGKESANTRCLYEIARDSGKPCVLAEDESHIPQDFKKFDKVGLCAGASTPDSVILKIENHFK